VSKYRIDMNQVEERRAPEPLVRYARVLLDRDVIEDAPLAVATYRFEPGQRGVKHSHPTQVEIYFGLKGRGEVEFLGEAHELTPGVLLYIPPQADHDTRNVGDEDFEFLSVFVPPVDLSMFRSWPACSEPRAAGRENREV